MPIINGSLLTDEVLSNLVGSLQRDAMLPNSPVSASTIGNTHSITVGASTTRDAVDVYNGLGVAVARFDVAVPQPFYPVFDDSPKMTEPKCDYISIEVDAYLHDKIICVIDDQRSRLTRMGLKPLKVIMDVSQYEQLLAGNRGRYSEEMFGMEICVFPSPYPVVLTDSYHEFTHKNALDTMRREFFDGYWSY